MNRIIFYLLLFVSTYTLAEPTAGFLLQDVGTEINIITRHNTRFYSDTATYANGGLTFVYPTDFWSFFGNLSAPRIVVSIQLNGAPSPTDTYSAVVSGNSDVSTTVIVYRISDGGGVNEAANGEVNVTIVGIQDVSTFI